MDKSERDLIVGTIADIEDSLEETEMRLQVLADDARAKRERLGTWKKRLAALDTDTSVHGRRPRGENLRAIKSCLEGTIEGLSASEVRNKTGLAWSSVQRVLAKNPSLFVEVNGLWKLRQRTAKTPNLATQNGNGAGKEAEGTMGQ
jgi:hypothetical protein